MDGSIADYHYFCLRRMANCNVSLWACGQTACQRGLAHGAGGVLSQSGGLGGVVPGKMPRGRAMCIYAVVRMGVAGTVPCGVEVRLV